MVRDAAKRLLLTMRAFVVWPLHSALILRSREAASRRMAASSEPDQLMVRDGATRLLTMRA
jgi:hypothetical protein